MNKRSSAAVVLLLATALGAGVYRSAVREGVRGRHDRRLQGRRHSHHRHAGARHGDEPDRRQRRVPHLHRARLRPVGLRGFQGCAPAGARLEVGRGSPGTPRSPSPCRPRRDVQRRDPRRRRRGEAVPGLRADQEREPDEGAVRDQLGGRDRRGARQGLVLGPRSGAAGSVQPDQRDRRGDQPEGPGERRRTDRERAERRRRPTPTIPRRRWPGTTPIPANPNYYAKDARQITRRSAEGHHRPAGDGARAAYRPGAGRQRRLQHRQDGQGRRPERRRGSPTSGWA